MHIAEAVASALEQMFQSGRRSNTVEVISNGTTRVFPVKYHTEGELIVARVQHVPADLQVDVHWYGPADSFAGAEVQISDVVPQMSIVLKTRSSQTCTAPKSL